MKKLTMALVAVMALASCGKTAAPVETPAATTETPAAVATGTTEAAAPVATGATEAPAVSTGAAQ